MTTPADILACIAEGRLDAVRARATALSNTLAEVEEMVREMRPTSEPVTVESGNTADLADLEEMRGILDGAGYTTTPDGLRGLLEVVAHLDQRREEADELDRRHAEALMVENAALRAENAALTPGPWRTVAEEAPPRGEMVAIVNNGDGAAFVYVTEIPSTGTADWVKLWRRLPAGLLDVPAPTVAP